VRYDQPLVAGTLVQRYKRFFADVEIGHGRARRTVTAHCANPGSMRTCAEPGGRVWLLPAGGPRRKLAWTWELAETGGAMICVNTARGNQLVAEALAAGVITELAGYDQIRREVACGDSRLDFGLTRGDGDRLDRCLVEVKTVTMDRGRGTAAFPDSVTSRGSRHLDELIAVRRAGHRAVLLFCAARADAVRVVPADDIDPTYGAALRRAAAAGVEILAYRCAIATDGMHLATRIDVVL
jgi:sugar fermentation stimulation protein A